MTLDRVEKYRETDGPFATKAGAPFGKFWIPNPHGKKFFQVVVAPIGSAAQYGWEHVSVSLPSRCPTWEEMCYLKNLFWNDDECVVQYHPRKSEYVNNHPHCLHLWRPLNEKLPEPPAMLVGLK